MPLSLILRRPLEAVVSKDEACAQAPAKESHAIALPLQGGSEAAIVSPHSFRSFTRFTQARTSASTSGSTALTSGTVMPALMRGS